jgi:hypothetical protein
VEETRARGENKQPVYPVYKYNYTCRYLIKKDISQNITEILLKVELNTITFILFLAVILA